VIYTQFLDSVRHTLSEKHTATPPDTLRTFNIAEAVVDEEAFGGILHPCLVHGLIVECRIGLTAEIFISLLIITKYDTFDLVA